MQSSHDYAIANDVYAFVKGGADVEPRQHENATAADGDAVPPLSRYRRGSQPL